MSKRHTRWYFDPGLMKAYEVVLHPQNTDMARVHDVGRSEHAAYYVDPKRLGRTEVEAIKLSKEDIEAARVENSRKLNELEKESFEIHRLLKICNEP
jgi:hypothetical protein